MSRPQWEGDERRMSSDDRLRSIELQVTRLVAHAESEAGNMASMIANIIKDLAEQRQEFKEHQRNDDEAFKTLRDQAGKHAMFIYIGIGILATLQFILKH